MTRRTPFHGAKLEGGKGEPESEIQKEWTQNITVSTGRVKTETNRKLGVAGECGKEEGELS